MKSAPLALLALAAFAVPPATAWPQAAAAPVADASKASTPYLRRFHRLRLRESRPNATSPDAQRPGPDRQSDQPLHPPDQAGWFQVQDQAGWGVDKDGQETVVGVYRRPAQPGIPGPQTYHTPEDRSAAGLSLSFKLGQ